jgi:hypothetical protein
LIEAVAGQPRPGKKGLEASIMSRAVSPILSSQEGTHEGPLKWPTKNKEESR